MPLVFVTAFLSRHLIEWIEKESARISSSFAADLAQLKSNAYLQICRDIGDASEHFRLDRSQRTVTTVTVIPGSPGATWEAVRWDEFRWDEPPREETVTVVAGSVTYNVRDIKDEVLRLYMQFDKTNPI